MRVREKILIYNRTFFGGGAEKVLLDYVRGLDKTKFDITVMVRRDEGAFREQFHALKQEGIHIRVACDWIKPGKNRIEKLRNYILLNVADWCEFRFPAVFYRIAIRERYDAEIAFMHNEAAAIIASSSNRNSKKLLWVHTDLRRINTWKLYFRTRRRQKKFFSKFDHCICVSQIAKQSVEELLGLKKNVMVLHNPVDRERIIQLAQEKCPLTEVEIPTICAVGRLSWEKNFCMLIRAHKNLLDKGVVHRLCIVGDGPERQRLEMLIEELGLKESVVLAGHQKNPYPFIAAADMTVCSSVYEGLHIASIESLVLGKTVVSCCSVVEEIFGGYECGLITENDQAALENGMERMLTDTELYKRCVDGAAERGKQLGLERAVQQLENVLEAM